MGELKVAVFGASGFVGSAVCHALESRGAVAVHLRAPRINPSSDSADTESLIQRASYELRHDMAGVSAVVNAAGISDAKSGESATLRGANSLLPAAVASTCATEGLRLVHISSAAVQGRRPCLDDSREVAPLTPYARSKAEGERLVHAMYPGAVVYRPPGVHGPTRAVTRSLARLSVSYASTVASPGDLNAPQVLIQDVADAVAFLALHTQDPPPVVHHPATGVTSASLLRLLSDGQEPRRISPAVARVAIALAHSAGRLSPGMAARARRLEVLWFGQAQAPSWLTAHGWQPICDESDWVHLGRMARSASELHTTTGKPS